MGKRSAICTAGLVAVVGVFGVYKVLQPPFWDTKHPLQASAGPVDFLADLDTDALDGGWKERRFFRIPPTDYQMTTYDGVPALRCTTSNSASILARDTEIALEDLPILSWRWIVEQPIESPVDESTEAGDDHPLRFYVRFSNAAGESKSAEIIWSNEKYAPGDYKIIGTFHHLVANGLDENTGSWHDQTVDLRKLYRDIGGTGEATLQVLGFFCDSDNTGARSDGYFADITLSAVE